MESLDYVFKFMWVNFTGCCIIAFCDQAGAFICVGVCTNTKKKYVSIIKDT